MFKYILFKTFNLRHHNWSVPNIIQYASSRAFGQLRGRVIIDYRKISVDTLKTKEEKNSNTEAVAFLSLLVL